MTLLLLAMTVGIVTGLRAYTPFALVCWAGHLGWISLAGTPLAFLGSIAAVIIVSLIALGELINDKRPQTGSRTALPVLAGRIVLAGLCGTAISFATESTWITGAGAAAVGALIGTFGGFYVRRAIVTGVPVPDLAVALVEDVIAIGGALIVVSHLH